MKQKYKRQLMNKTIKIQVFAKSEKASSFKAYHLYQAVYLVKDILDICRSKCHLIKFYTQLFIFIMRVWAWTCRFMGFGTLLDYAFVCLF